MPNAADAPFVRVVGPGAQLIASLWRDLPPGEQARCHVPRFGFRFFDGDRLVSEASVCWQCNNIRGSSGGRKMAYEFDSSVPASRRLLEETRRITGVEVIE